MVDLVVLDWMLPASRASRSGAGCAVTVVGPELAAADAYATAALAMACEGPRWLATLRGHDSLAILADGTTLSTPGFPRVR